MDTQNSFEKHLIKNCIGSKGITHKNECISSRIHKNTHKLYSETLELNRIKHKFAECQIRFGPIFKETSRVSLYVSGLRLSGVSILSIFCVIPLTPPKV